MCDTTLLCEIIFIFFYYVPIAIIVSSPVQFQDNTFSKLQMCAAPVGCSSTRSFVSIHLRLSLSFLLSAIVFFFIIINIIFIIIIISRIAFCRTLRPGTWVWPRAGVGLCRG